MEIKNKTLKRILAFLGSGALMLIVTVCIFLWQEFSPPRAPQKIVDLLEEEKDTMIAIATAQAQEENSAEVRELSEQLDSLKSEIAALESNLSEDDLGAVEEARERILGDAPNIVENVGEGESIVTSPSPTPIVNEQSTPITESQLPGETSTVILSENSDNNYNWSEGGIYVTSLQVYEGEVAFISNGNNSFSKDLGVVGYEADEIRYISFKAYLLEKEAALLLQVQIDNSWEHRWGFDGRNSYSGSYNWSRRGQTTNMLTGTWVDITLDVFDDLGARPGQTITGMAFSGSDGKFIYDLVTFEASEPVDFCQTEPAQDLFIADERVLLSSTDDFAALNWRNSDLYATSQAAVQDDVSFIANGNNITEQEFGVIGYESNEIRYINLWVCLRTKEAGLLLQTKVDNSWEHRWGIDGRNSYQGGYSWARRGVSVNVPVNQWFQIQIDLIEDLEARPGQVLTGLAFTGDDGNLLFDRVSFLESE